MGREGRQLPRRQRPGDSLRNAFDPAGAPRTSGRIQRVVWYTWRDNGCCRAASSAATRPVRRRGGAKPAWNALGATPGAGPSFPSTRSGGQDRRTGCRPVGTIAPVSISPWQSASSTRTSLRKFRQIGSRGFDAAALRLKDGSGIDVGKSKPRQRAYPQTTHSSPARSSSIRFTLLRVMLRRRRRTFCRPSEVAFGHRGRTPSGRERGTPQSGRDRTRRPAAGTLARGSGASLPTLDLPVDGSHIAICTSWPLHGMLRATCRSRHSSRSWAAGAEVVEGRLKLRAHSRTEHAFRILIDKDSPYLLLASGYGLAHAALAFPLAATRAAANVMELDARRARTVPQLALLLAAGGLPR